MDYKNYCKLEKLISTGGDPNEIESLRRELGITIDERPTPQANKFDVGQYKKYKRRNVPDRLIAEEFGMSLPTLVRQKRKHGLVKSRT